jgi:hypothetical protein
LLGADAIAGNEMMLVLPVLANSEATLESAFAVMGICLVVIPAALLALAWNRGLVSRTKGRWILAAVVVISTLGAIGYQFGRQWSPVAPTATYSAADGLEVAGLDGYAAIGNNPSTTTYTAPRYVVVVSSGETFRFAMTVRNGSSIGIRIVGLVPFDPGTVGRAGFQILEAEVGSRQGNQELMLAPGEAVELEFVGKVEPCQSAVGDSDRVSDVIAAIRLQIEVGGLRGLSSLWPPFELDTSKIPGCVSAANAEG